VYELREQYVMAGYGGSWNQVGRHRQHFANVEESTTTTRLEMLANPAPLQLPGSIDVNSGLMVLEMSEAFVQSCLSGGLLRLLRVD
jgi:hypothetical protein